MTAGPALSFPWQIIDGDGVFNVDVLDHFVKESHLVECGDSYTVVSVMGPQSSGKSTLLNHLFHTNFREMDFDEGRSQITQGVWMAMATGLEPCTLVMNLEGNDGRERGEDDTSFERQVALFALAISDVVLINMWCHDIGREQASNKHLLRTVFQVMARLFCPRRITLLFVLRDKTKSPLKKLESTLREDVQKIWDLVSNSGARQGTALSDFFDVHVVALSSFEDKEEHFIEEVACLRESFSRSLAPGVFARDTGAMVHASGFSINALQIWQRIKENKDLDLPSLTVMVSTLRCEEIAREKFHTFPQTKDWQRLEDAARSGSMPGFARELNAVINSCLSGFTNEAIHFDEDVRISKERQLEEKLLIFMEPAFLSVLGHFSSESFGKFKESFDLALDSGEGFSAAAHSWTQHYLASFDELCAGVTIERAKWDTSGVRDNLRRDMDGHVALLQSDKLSELTRTYEMKLYDSLAGPVEKLFENADDETWSSIRELLQRETECAVAGFSDSLSGFEIGVPVKMEMFAKLHDHAKGVVETKAREGAKRVLMLMKERFSRLFLSDGNSNKRTWTKDDNIEAISKDSYSALAFCHLQTAMVLSALSVMWLDDLADETKSTRVLSVERLVDQADDIQIVQSMVLISPAQRQSLWKKLVEETEGMVNHAISLQEAKKGNGDWIQAAFNRSGCILKAAAPFIQQVVTRYFFGGKI